MNKILITGGSGFIGTNMVDYYVKKGVEVLNVDIIAPLDPNQNKYWSKSDINNLDELYKIFRDYKPTHVVHLAAGTGMGVTDISHFKTNFDGVKTLIKACNDVDVLKKVVFTSSLLVCERSYVPKHDEDFKPDSLYGESKILSEKIVRDSNLIADWAIVRPTAVWGPWFRSSYTTFFNLVVKGLYVNPGKKKLEKPATFVGNTVFMMDKILNSNKTNYNVYYLADYPEYSIQEWANSISYCVGNSKPITIPKLLVNGLAKIGDILKLVRLFPDPPLTSFRLNNIISGVKYDLHKTKDIVGDLPFNLNSGVEGTLDWMNIERK